MVIFHSYVTVYRRIVWIQFWSARDVYILITSKFILLWYMCHSDVSFVLLLSLIFYIYMYIWYMIFDKWYLTSDIWYMIYDSWYMIYDRYIYILLLLFYFYFIIITTIFLLYIYINITCMNEHNSVLAIFSAQILYVRRSVLVNFVTSGAEVAWQHQAVRLLQGPRVKRVRCCDGQCCLIKKLAAGVRVSEDCFEFLKNYG